MAERCVDPRVLGNQAPNQHSDTPCVPACCVLSACCVKRTLVHIS